MLNYWHHNYDFMYVYTVGDIHICIVLLYNDYKLYCLKIFNGMRYVHNTLLSTLQNAKYNPILLK